MRKLLAMLVIITGCTPVTDAPINLYIQSGDGYEGLAVMRNAFEVVRVGKFTPGQDDFIVHLEWTHPPKTPFRIRWSINGDTIDEMTIVPTKNPLPPISTRWHGAYSGNHILRVIIDPENRIAETDEKDNEYTLTFSIPD